MNRFVLSTIYKIPLAQSEERKSWEFSVSNIYCSRPEGSTIKYLAQKSSFSLPFVIFKWKLKKAKWRICSNNNSKNLKKETAGTGLLIF